MDNGYLKLKDFCCCWPVLFNLKLTIDKVETLTKEASRNGASLVVFPEAFISAYPKGLNFGASDTLSPVASAVEEKIYKINNHVGSHFNLVRA